MIPLNLNTEVAYKQIEDRLVVKCEEKHDYISERKSYNTTFKNESLCGTPVLKPAHMHVRDL